METLAPPVVAVVVAHDPGPWFEETLASIASQDYAELSVLVLGTGHSEDLAVRVAEVLPSAYVRQFDGNRGFGATVNHVRSMVDGAAYYLLCHDDVALDEIELYTDVLAAVAASDGPLPQNELDAALGLRACA